MSADRLHNLRHHAAQLPLPAALVDVVAFDHNLALLLAPLRQHGKRVRLATKSLRCPALLARAVAGSGGLVDGLMTFTARETLLWAQQGRTWLGDVAGDLLLGYPPGGMADALLLAEANRHAVAGAMVDDAVHLRWLSQAAVQLQVTVPIWFDLDMGWRPLHDQHIGVRRSPLRSAADVQRLVAILQELPGLSLAGVMGYEAHVAGLPDRGRSQMWQNPLKRWLKRASWPDIVARRAQVVVSLRQVNPQLRCNGGGSGSVQQTALDGAVTEVTIGSGLLCGHLFDGYDGLPWQPCLHFALPVARLPGPGLATCNGGGWIASGSVGPERLPRPVFPPSSTLLSLEGAGEVQTPVVLAANASLAIGDPVLFRPAKSGELAEIFASYHLVGATEPETVVPTYRGLGWSAWG